MILEDPEVPQPNNTTLTDDLLSRLQDALA